MLLSIELCARVDHYGLKVDLRINLGFAGQPGALPTVCGQHPPAARSSQASLAAHAGLQTENHDRDCVYIRPSSLSKCIINMSLMRNAYACLAADTENGHGLHSNGSERITEAERRVRSPNVALPSPRLDHDLRFLQRVKVDPVQAPIPQVFVRGLAAAVLPGTPRLDVQDLGKSCRQLGISTLGRESNDEAHPLKGPQELLI